MSKFDLDPDAIEWARLNVEEVIKKYEDFQKRAEDKGNKEAAARWRTVVFALKREFIGGEGCVIARFDKRRPQFERLMNAE